MNVKRKISIRNMVLRTLATAGVVSVALVAPKAIRLLKQFDRAAARRKNLYKNVQLALWRLEKQGLITVSALPGRRSVRLTKQGASTIGSIYAAEYTIPEPAFWDGKWRILMFDISEKRKRARNMLRRLLQSAGFIRLQDSVWIYPYPCDEFVELVRAHLRSGTGELQYFVAEALESGRRLRTHFNLT